MYAQHQALPNEASDFMHRAHVVKWWQRVGSENRHSKYSWYRRQKQWQWQGRNCYHYVTKVAWTNANPTCNSSTSDLLLTQLSTNVTETSARAQPFLKITPILLQIQKYVPFATHDHPHQKTNNVSYWQISKTLNCVYLNARQCSFLNSAFKYEGQGGRLVLNMNIKH